MMRQLLFICCLSVLHSTCKLTVKRNAHEAVHHWNKLTDNFGCPQTRDYICNLHNPRYNCTCYRPNQFNSMHYPSCDEMFHLQNIRAYVIELRTKMPRFPNYVDNFDTFLSEIIEDYLAIDAKYLVILRKRCSNGSMVAQIAFLRATNYTLPNRIKIDNLQTVHPTIFTNNEEFMQQPYLPIESVKEADFLTPVLRQSKESIKYISQLKLRETPVPAASSVWSDIGFVVILSLVVIVGNMIPIYFLWRVIRDRRTHSENSKIQMTRL